MLERIARNACILATIRGGHLLRHKRQHFAIIANATTDGNASLGKGFQPNCTLVPHHPGKLHPALLRELIAGAQAALVLALNN